MEQEFDERFWVCVSRHCVAAHESAHEATPVHLGKICEQCQYVHQCYKTGNAGYWPTANAILKQKSGIGCQFMRPWKD